LLHFIEDVGIRRVQVIYLDQVNGIQHKLVKDSKFIKLFASINIEVSMRHVSQTGISAWKKKGGLHTLVMITFGSLLNGCSMNPDPYQQSGYYIQDPSYSAAPQTISSAQLQSLVSPIALYPDSLLSLMLLASTYPLEVAEAYNWRNSNASLKGDALQNALKAQSWNDSVKSLISFPQAFNMLGSKLQWTQNLGNAYKIQAADTMKAVQVLRKKAVNAGTLKSNKENTVSTDASGNLSLIHISEPTRPCH
jgi:hypothetical protein